MSALVKVVLWCLVGVFMLFHGKAKTGRFNPLLAIGLLILGLPLIAIALCAVWCFIVWIFVVVKVAFETNIGFGILMLIAVIGALLVGIGNAMVAWKEM